VTSAGRAAVVTGAGSGIGAAIARRLAAADARVLCCDIADGAVHGLAEEIGGVAVHLDVSDPDGWADLAERLDREALPLGPVALNAGMLTTPDPRPFLDVPLERLDRVRGVNLDGVLLGVRALAPLLARDGGGAVVATASLAGLGPYADDPMYAATKHAIVGFVRSVAPQLATQGIRLHAICPGGVDTGLLGADRKAAIAAAGRPMLDPDEVAAAVLDLLASPDAGLVRTIVSGRGPEDYAFRGVPGPRP
jgi:NAD(P)-dependent dehydrogenase (short-subunit alcohol dehydrogenase family)